MGARKTPETHWPALPTYNSNTMIIIIIIIMIIIIIIIVIIIMIVIITPTVMRNRRAERKHLEAQSEQHFSKPQARNSNPMSVGRRPGMERAHLAAYQGCAIVSGEFRFLICRFLHGLGFKNVSGHVVKLARGPLRLRAGNVYPTVPRVAQEDSDKGWRMVGSGWRGGGSLACVKTPKPSA